MVVGGGVDSYGSGVWVGGGFGWAPLAWERQGYLDLFMSLGACMKQNSQTGETVKHDKKCPQTKKYNIKK